MLDAVHQSAFISDAGWVVPRLMDLHGMFTMTDKVPLRAVYICGSCLLTAVMPVGQHLNLRRRHVAPMVWE